MSASTAPASCLITRSNGKSSPDTKTTLKPPSFPSPLTAVNVTLNPRPRRRTISCRQAVSATSVDNDEKDASVSGSAEAEEEAKIGATVRVKVPLSKCTMCLAWPRWIWPAWKAWLNNTLGCGKGNRFQLIFLTKWTSLRILKAGDVSSSSLILKRTNWNSLIRKILILNHPLRQANIIFFLF